MSQEGIVILNFLLYTMVSLYCINKYGLKNIGTILSFIYTLSAWFSYFYFKNPLFDISTGKSFTINLESILYLFTINCLLFLPFTKLNLFKIKKHTNVNWKLIIRVLKVLFIVYSIILLFDIPAIWGSMHSSLELTDLRDATYSEGRVESNIFIIKLMARFFGGLKLLFFFLAFYGLVYFKGKKKIFWMCIILYVLGIIATTVQVMSRATVIHFIFELILCFVIFYRDIDEKIRRRFYLIVAGGLSFLLVFFWAITQSRFKDSENLDAKEAINISLIKYAGEAQLNFCSLLYDRTNDMAWGYNLVPLYRRFLGLEYSEGIDSDIRINYMEKKMNAPSFIFYQLTGALYASFGKYGTLLLALIFFLSVKRMFKSNYSIYFYKIYIVLLLSSIVAKGIFFATFGNEEGNLSFLFAIFFYYYFKNTAFQKPFKALTPDNEANTFNYLHKTDQAIN